MTELVLQFVPSPELKISLGLEETEIGRWPRDRGEDILDFFFKMLRDLTVTSTGFWVVGFRNSLCSFLLFFTTNFFPFLSFITTLPILFDFAPKTSFSSDLLSLIERLFSWRLSCRFWFLSFAILSICKAETKIRFSGSYWKMYTLESNWMYASIREFYKQEASHYLGSPLVPNLVSF